MTVKQFIKLLQKVEEPRLNVLVAVDPYEPFLIPDGVEVRDDLCPSEDAEDQDKEMRAAVIYLYRTEEGPERE